MPEHFIIYGSDDDIRYKANWYVPIWSEMYLRGRAFALGAMGRRIDPS